jgi:hypothetical protein
MTAQMPINKPHKPIAIPPGIKVDYIDRDGIKRRVLLPDAYADPAEGIPVSLPVEQLYSHMPPAFQAALVTALWARDLIEPADFLAPGAAERARAALLEVVKHDALNMLSFAGEYKESLNHG